MSATITALHFTDPGCPWAYSFRPAWTRLVWRFGDQLDWRLVLIGLAESHEQYAARGYTPERMALGLRRFGRRFGMPFEAHVKPRVAGTSRACRAIVAAREIDPALGEGALRALQLMHFTTPGLLDEDADLRAALAMVPGLDAEAVVARIDDPAVLEAYEADRARAREAAGSPTHAQDRTAATDGPVRYTAPSVLFVHQDGRSIEVGGFQPFESYDTALANLDPTLERRPGPASVREVLEAFPAGLSTAEVAAVLRASDLDETDVPGARRELEGLVLAGVAVREPVGDDALWRPAVAAPAPSAVLHGGQASAG
ncbi:MAG TPA: DsbA family protein [Baekduia sp.]|nr:DsbA family protein [Baekduia sp.]